MANGDVLDKLQEKLEKLLNKKKLPPSDRAVIEVMQLLVIFLSDDHEKVAEIYPTFKILRWAGIVLASLNIGLLWDMLTGK